MDQHILTWIGLQETGRHNAAQERLAAQAQAETERHNQALEKEARLTRLGNSISNTLNRTTSLQQAYIQAQASRDNARTAANASRYSAERSEASSRYATKTRYLESLLDYSIQSRRNTIQSEYNRGQLAMSARQLQESHRANVAREEENRLSRLQNRAISQRDYEQRLVEFGYKREQDWLNRGQQERFKEADIRTQYAKMATDVLTAGMKAKMFQKMWNADSSTGGTTHGKTKSEETLFDRLDKELTRQGR